MKNRIKKLRKITVEGQEYKYLVEGSRKERTVSIWKNKVSFFVKEFRLTDITPSFIEELIREKESNACTCNSGHAMNACKFKCDAK